MKKHILWTLVVALWGMIGISAKTVEIHVTTPGTFICIWNKISPEQRKQIDKLVLRGQLNNKDCYFLRPLFGFDYSQARVKAQLRSLDLGDAEFIEDNSRNSSPGYMHYVQVCSIKGRRTIPKFLFRNCFIEEVVLPKNTERICAGAFEFSSIKRIVIPETVRVIEHYAFNNCYELSEVTIEGDLDYLGCHAFTYCAGLRTLCFNAVRCVGKEASPVHDCDKLEEIVFNGKVELSGGWSSYDSDMANPEEFHNTFVHGCPNLQRVTFKAESFIDKNYRIYYDCPKIKFATYKTTGKLPAEYIIY